jgi:hypothetical protein
VRILGKDKTFSQLLAALLYYTKTVISGFLSTVPQFVFGNSVGLKHNIVPRIELQRLRMTYRSRTADHDREAVARARELKSNGVSIFREQNDITPLTAIKHKLKLIYEDEQYYLYSPNRTQKRIINPLEVLPELKALFPDIIANTIIAYYGCPFRILSIQVWRNLGVACDDRARNKLDYMSNTLHNDYWPVTHLRVFTILSDNVTKRTGALRYHGKQATKSIMRSFNYFHRFLLPRKSFNRLYHPDRLNYFEGRLGDSSLVNTQEVLHGSSVPDEGTFRDIVQFLIVPASGPVVRGRDLFEDVPADQEMMRALEEGGRRLPPGSRCRPDALKTVSSV